MKLKNILLIAPLLLIGTTSLSSCDEKSKFETTKVKNVRLENKILKWDRPTGFEDPYTQIKIGDFTQNLGNSTEFDLSNFVKRSGKLDVSLITKSTWLSFMYKESEVVTTLDVDCLPIPHYEFTSYTNGDDFNCSIYFDEYIDGDFKYEVCFQDEITLVEPTKVFSINTLFNEPSTIRIRTVSDSETIFNSPYVYEHLMILDTPEVEFEGRKLSWKPVDYAYRYQLVFSPLDIVWTTETSYTLPSNFKNGTTFTFRALPWPENSHYRISDEVTLTFNE